MKKIMVSCFLLLAILSVLNISVSYADQYQKPVLSTPLPGQIFWSERRPVFSWRAVPGATEYQIQIATFEFPVGNFNLDRCTVNDLVTSTSYQPPEDMQEIFYGERDRYYWRVRATIYPDERGMEGWSDWSDSASFHIWSPPVVSRLISPPNNSRLDVLWPEFKGEGGGHSFRSNTYRIQVATDPAFNNLVINEPTDSAGGGFRSPIALEYNTTYYWRMRYAGSPQAPEGTPLPSPWSEVFNFSIYQLPPPKVILRSPCSGEDVASPITFTWEPVPDARGYTVQIADSNDFTNVLLRLFASTNSVSALFRHADGTYYWRVQAGNLSGNGDWSDPGFFDKTSRIPEAVRLIEPENAARINSLTPVFNWDDDGLMAGSYHLQVSRSSTFDSLLLDKDDIPPGRGIISSTRDLNAGPTYYWRMRRNQGPAWGPWSEVRNFRTDLSAVSSASVRLGEPANGSTLNPHNPPRVSWLPQGRNYRNYNFQISTDQYFRSIVFEGFTTNIAEFFNLESGGTYYWRVRAQDDIGWGPWSEVWSFIKVRDTYGPCSLEIRDPKGVVDTTRPPFSWYGYWHMDRSDERAHYALQVATDPGFTHVVLYFDSSLLNTADFRRSRGGTTTILTYIPNQDFLPGYQYYWRIKARDAGWEYWTDWSAPETFSIVSSFLPITLISPENNVFLKSSRPRFSWSSENMVREFELEVSADYFATTLFKISVSDTGGSGHVVSTDAAQNLRDNMYYWHVRRKTQGANWSESRRFTVDTTPPNLRIIAPVGEEIKIASQTIPATVNISCEITDSGAGVDRVEFYLGRHKVTERNRPYQGSTYVAEITGLNEGRHTITVKAFDKASSGGNMAEVSFIVEVERSMGIKEQPRALEEPAVTGTHNFRVNTHARAAEEFARGGIKLMGGMSMTSRKVSGEIPPEFKKSKMGFIGGLGFESGGPIGFETDLLFTSGGTILDATVDGQTAKNTIIGDTGYRLAVPLLLKVRFMPGTTPYVLAGGDIGYILSQKVLIEYNGQSEERDVKDKINRLYYGLVFGGGLELQTGSMNLLFEARYNLGLSNQAKEANPGEYAKVTAFSIVIGFKF